MPYKQPIEELSRQPLVKGTTKFTDPTGNLGYSNEDIIASALVRIAGAMEAGRLQLPTAVVQIQPQHADEFIQLVTEVVAGRPGRIYIAAWHLEDEHVLKVTLAYERGESLFVLGRYWENKRRAQLLPEPPFSDEDHTDGLNHLKISRIKDTRRITAEFLATSPEMAEKLYDGFAGTLEVLIKQANEQEGGQGHD